MTDRAELMKDAIKLRKDLGEDSSSPIDIFSLAAGIEKLTLVFYPLGENLSGMCIKGESGSCIIAINSEMSLGRQRFSLAHEFYHMYFDKTMVAICANKIGVGGEVEKMADAFASFFLMPADELDRKAAAYAMRHKDGKLTLEDIIRIEHYFGVSHKAVMMGLKHNPHMNSRRFDEYFELSVKGMAATMGYDCSLYCPLPESRRRKTLGRYIDLAGQLIKRELISNGKYEELLLSAFRPDLVYGENEEFGVVD